MEDVLQSIRKCDMHMNLAKCFFRVQTGKFIRFMLTSRGIEANPDKIHGVVTMRNLTNVKEMQ